MSKHLEVVIITGMSGAGKTVAMQSFEDLGYFVVDNMLPNLLSRFLDIVKESVSITKVALVVDLRSKDFYDQIQPAFEELRNRQDVTTQLLFLDATDEELVSRYKETRRSHPLAPQGRVLMGIETERQLLLELKNQAEVVIDTSKLTPRQLRQRIIDNFNSDHHTMFYVEVLSFGFKYGLPLDADIVMDVRFLPNPYYIKKLRPLTGKDKAVSDYVMRQDATEDFYQHFYSLLVDILPGYQKEGKSSLTIAIGCTGGQHRSVAIAERLAQELGQQYKVNVSHRDIEKRKESTNRS
ncbi:RNase adapter RapZ [Paucilactobacillus sp. N302-9]|jgi:UPF0042 nucleotide-binding protein